MVYDFHTHTFLSDGVLSPAELIRRAFVKGYKAIAITDHVGLGDQERIIEILVKECALATRELGILAIPGVELTHIPKRRINEAAQKAKELGAQLVIVHGETIVEPVEEGTNRAALLSSAVNILAHPGLITEEDVALAAERGIFLELSARRGHSLTNGHLARMAQLKRAPLLLNSDSHEPQDLLTPDLALQLSRGSGLSEDESHHLLALAPQRLLQRLRLSPVEGTDRNV